MFGYDFCKCLPDNHPDFKANDNNTHINTASGIRVMQIIFLMIAQLLKAENMRKEMKSFLHLDPSNVRFSSHFISGVVRAQDTDD